MTSRRDFLKSIGGVGMIGVSKSLFPAWMPRMAFRPPQQTGRGDVLVAIFLRGGIDGLSVVVPFGAGAHYYDSLPTIAVPEPGSAETPAQRNARLKRECKGRPNAGACLGFAS